MPVIRAARRAFCVVLICSCMAQGRSFGAGSAAPGGRVLELIADPQSAGYAGTLMAFPDSAGSFLRNPAASARMYRTRILAADSFLPEGGHYLVAALCAPLSFGTVGVSAGYLGYGDAAPGPDTDDIMVAFNYSRPVYRHGTAREMAGAAGVNVKIIDATRGSDQARAAAFDLGGFYRLPFSHRWTMGAALRNIGGKMRFDGREDTLPSVFELGARYGDPDTDRAGIMAGFERDLADDTNSWTMGAGFSPFYPLVLRAGWKGPSDAADAGIKGGVGFEFNDVSFSYAVGETRSAAPVHWIGVDMGWGGISDPSIAYNHHLRSHFIHARDQYLRKDYIAARQELEEILSMYPDHAPSKEYLGRISDELDIMEEERMRKISLYVRKAGVAMDRRDYMRAKRFYTAIQGIDPENGLAEKGLKKISEEQGRVRLAQSARKNRGQIDRAWKEAVNRFRRGELVTAREKFMDIIAMDPENAEARGFIERIDTQLGKVTELQLNDIFARGMGFFNKGDFLTAKKYFTAVITANPGRSDARQYAELCASRLSEQTERAESRKNVQVRTQAEDEVEELYARGVTYFENGSFDESLKTLGRSRDLAHDNKLEAKAERARNTMADIRTSLGEERFKAGYELFQSNRFEAAAAEYRKALGYNPEYAPARVELDRVSEILSRQYYEQGMKDYVANDTKKARAAFRKALSYNKNMEEARRALQRLSQ